MIFGRLKQRIHGRVMRYSHDRRAPVVLGVVSFVESSFFPFPPDFLLMPMVVARRHKWVRFALITTIWSVVGGLFGYLLGTILFDTVGESIVQFYNLENELARVGGFFADNAFFTMFTSAFTPIPFKVFTISAGVFEIPLTTFVSAALIGRGGRFFGEALLMSLFGDKIGKTILKYLNIVAIALVIVIGIIIYITAR